MASVPRDEKQKRRPLSKFGDDPAEIISEHAARESAEVGSVPQKPQHHAAANKKFGTPLKDTTFVDEEIGWCVHLVPDAGILKQMEELKRLKEEQPSAALALSELCERMVKYAATGDLGALKACCSEVLGIRAWRGQPPPLWYVARMLKECGPEAHLACVRWLVKGGGVTPRAVPPLNDLVHLVIERSVAVFAFNGSGGGGGGGAEGGVGASAAVEEEKEAQSQVLGVLNCLVREGKFDVAQPRKPDGWTPLHVACSRNLVAVARHLVLELGADVNSVGLDDKMPLTLADRTADLLHSRHRIATQNAQRFAKMQLKKQRRREQKRKEQEQEEKGALEASKASSNSTAAVGGKESGTPSKQSDEENEDSEDDDESEDDDDGEASDDAIAVSCLPPPPPAVTPLQEFLLSRGARRTWRREPAPPAPAAAKPSAKPVRARFNAGNALSSEDAAASGAALRAAAAADLATPAVEPSVTMRSGSTNSSSSSRSSGGGGGIDQPGYEGSADVAAVVEREEGGFSFSTE